MFYTYVLMSLKNKRLYVGSTSDLRRRVKEHNEGKGGEHTKRHKPFKVVFYEAFLSIKDAQKQEKFYKSGYGREVLKDKIRESINEVEIHCPVV